MRRFKQIIRISMVFILMGTFISCSKFNSAVNDFNQGKYEESVKSLMELIDEGTDNDDVMLYLAMNYSKLYDISSAKEWYSKYIDEQGIDALLKHAEQFPEVAAEMGYRYDNGVGIDVNDKQSLYFSQKAAEGGSVRGKYNLAMLYLYGRGVTKDDDAGLKLLNECEKVKYQKASRYLAHHFYNKGDMKKAMDHYNKVSHDLYDFVDITIVIGNYLAGIGVSKNSQDYAFKFKEELMDKYDPNADDGTLYNFVRILYYWYNKLMDSEREIAVNELNRLADKKFSDADGMRNYIKNLDSRKRYAANYDKNNPSSYTFSDGTYLATVSELQSYLNAPYPYTPSYQFCKITRAERNSNRDIFKLANPYPPTIAVDLGLSVKWAPFNLGAENNSELGSMLAWGELKPKSDYTWATYEYCKGSGNTIIPIGRNIAGTMYDAATKTWGNYWRMPTSAEYKELIERCDISYQGNQLKITGPNGNSISFPFDNETFSFGSYYWASDVKVLSYFFSSEEQGPYYFSVSSSMYEVQSNTLIHDRYEEGLIRPVLR